MKEKYIKGAIARLVNLYRDVQNIAIVPDNNIEPNACARLNNLYLMTSGKDSLIKTREGIVMNGSNIFIMKYNSILKIL